MKFLWISPTNALCSCGWQRRKSRRRVESRSSSRRSRCRARCWIPRAGAHWSSQGSKGLTIPSNLGYPLQKCQSHRRSVWLPGRFVRMLHKLLQKIGSCVAELLHRQRSFQEKDPTGTMGRTAFERATWQKLKIFKRWWSTVKHCLAKFCYWDVNRTVRIEIPNQSEEENA